MHVLSTASHALSLPPIHAIHAHAHPTAPPIFVLDPQNTTVTIGNTVTLICSAKATPLPNITWINQNSNGTVMDEDVFNVSFSTTSDVRTSELTFVAGQALAGVNRFCCLANNSESAVVIVESKCIITARLYTINIMSL